MNLVVMVYLDINLGDDLFLKTLIDRYSDHNLYILTKNNTYMKHFEKYNNIFNISYKEAIVNTSKYDSCVIIGGSIFQDYGNKRDYLNYIRRNIVVKSFELIKKPVFIIGSNIGPINTKLGEIIFKYTFNNASFISVRDSKSCQLLQQLKIKDKYGVYPDIVFSINDKSCSNILKQETLGISIINYGREKEQQLDYINKIVEIVDKYTHKNNNKVYLFGFDSGNENDEIIIDEILNRIDRKINIEKVIYKGDIDEFLCKFKSSTFIIGSRFHSIILALKYKIPFFAIIYSDKTKNLLYDINYNLESKEYKYIDDLDIDDLINKINNRYFNYEIDNKYIEKSEGHFKYLDEFINENIKK